MQKNVGWTSIRIAKQSRFVTKYATHLGASPIFPVQCILNLFINKQEIQGMTKKKSVAPFDWIS